MSSSEDSLKDTFENINNVVTFPSMDDNAVQLGISHIASDRYKLLSNSEIITADSAATSASSSAYVLILTKEHLTSMQDTLSTTLRLVKATDHHFLHSLEPPLKKEKTDLQPEENLKGMLDTLHKTVTSRLQGLESRIDDISVKCQNLQGEVENMLKKMKNPPVNKRRGITPNTGRPGPLVGSPSQLTEYSKRSFSERRCRSESVTLNSEADFPDGSWLGDPAKPEMRVRCAVSPEDLDYCNQICLTPEKMSLMLLDYLFDREIQACSNISGTGWHGKKQLDPLKIYGIRCHLTYMFGITDKDWRRIRLNLDSKCRTAFRRKQKGMPLCGKSTRERSVIHDTQDAAIQTDKCSLTATTAPRSVPDIVPNNTFPKPEVTSSSKQSMEDDCFILPTVKLESSDIETISLQIQGITEETQVIHTEHADIEVLHATAEQLAALKDGHDVQILPDGNMLSDINVHDMHPS